MSEKQEGKLQKTGTFYNANPTIFQFAESNRKNLTEAEALLWARLKNKQLKGYKFRRQHPLGAFILDFYCHKAALGIEIDGGYHNRRLQKEYDEQRTVAIMEEIGINIVRFTNQDIFNNMDFVLKQIESYLNI
jgi:very-short-patch-repair endonuclease